MAELVETIVGPVRHLVPWLDHEGYKTFTTLDAWGEPTEGTVDPWGRARPHRPGTMQVRCVVMGGLEVFMEQDEGATLEAALVVLAAERHDELRAAASLLLSLDLGLSRPRPCESPGGWP